MKNYKYSTSFSSTIKIITPSDEDRYLSKASLENLKQYFPNDIRPDDNPDLLYIAFAGFNGGIFNKNGDGVTKETAISIAEKFKNKYINLEHDRKTVIGNIISHGFTKHGENSSITKEEALAYDGPIDVILSGYIWQVVNSNLVNLIIEASDEGSLKYNQIGASWELLYTDYDIGLGNKNVSEAKIISDIAEIEKYSKYLKSNGGKGKCESGEEVFKLIKGDCLPVGVGIVARPAAFLSGVSVLENKPTLEQQEKITEDLKATETNIIEINDLDKLKEIVASDHHIDKCSCGEIISQCRCGAPDKKINIIEAGCTKCKENLEKEKNNNDFNKNISLSQKNSVNDITKQNSDISNSKISPVNKNKIKNMIKLKFNDSDKEVLETAASVEVYEIAKELNKKMSEYSDELDIKKNEVKAAQEASTKLKETSDALAADLEKVKVELTKLNEVRAQEKVQADFSVRMADLNEKFELDADKSKSIAAQIRGLDDASFATWLESFKPFLVAKKVMSDKEKADLEDKTDDGDDEADENPDGSKKKSKAKKEAKASILEELASLQSKDKKIVNKIAEGQKSISDLFNEAFADESGETKENKNKE